MISYQQPTWTVKNQAAHLSMKSSAPSKSGTGLVDSHAESARPVSMRLFEVVNIVIHKEMHINQGEFFDCPCLYKKSFQHAVGSSQKQVLRDKSQIFQYWRCNMLVNFKAMSGRPIVVRCLPLLNKVMHRVAHNNWG